MNKPSELPNAYGTIAPVSPGLVSTVLLRRPDGIQAEYQLRAANANIGAARAALFPRITLTGLLGFASSALLKLFTGGAFGWSAGADATYTIFQAGAGRANVRVFSSLGQLRYLSLMAQVDAVAGNSSSGLYEAPSFRVPTINIGDRQRGRTAPESVIQCEPERAAISAALEQSQGLDCSAVVNPYGDGDAAPRIVAAVRDLAGSAASLKKIFHLL